jgi:hypothetical protein
MRSINRFFGTNNKIKEHEIIETKSTLETYKTCFVSRGTKEYLKNIEDYGISKLKLLVRTNCLPINDVSTSHAFKAKWSLSIM